MRQARWEGESAAGPTPALAPQDAHVGEGQLARHGEEQLARIKPDARAERGLAREPLLEEPFPGGEAI